MVVTPAFNPSIWEAEAGECLWVQGHPGLQSKFQDRLQSYTEKSCLKKLKPNQNKQTKQKQF